MKTGVPLLLAALLAFITASTAVADQESHHKAAEDLLKITGIEKQLQTAIDQTLDIQIKANPQIAPLRDVLAEFLHKYMSWDGIKDDLIKIYADAFSEEELVQITEFYKTPVGKKMVSKMPELMTKGMQLGAKKVADNQGELREMIQESMKAQKQ